MSRQTLLALALAGALSYSSVSTAAAHDWRAKATPHVVASVARGEAIDVLIKMRGDAGLRLVDQQQAFDAKVALVAANLRALAEATQAPLIAQLRAQGATPQSLWIANAIAVRLTPEQVMTIAQRDDVAVIESDRAFKQALEPTEPASPAGDAKAVGAIEPNVTRVRAPEAWARGYRGQGVVVAGQDTGYQWDHPALKAKYRGWDGATATHDYNWHDAITADIDGSSNSCGINAPAPCDDNSHGSHTMGTVLGDDGGSNQTGVAPDAKWIGCRNMDAGTGRPSTYINCMQWFLAPTDLAGANPDATKAPHIITNSWGCPIGPPPSGEDCAVNSFDATLTALRAAGIMMVVSAGNSGSSCATVLAPPSYSGDVFTIGAANNSDVIASFSSRGPATQDGSNRLKPDVVGPGVSVRSSVPGGGYGSKSGTSMSAPNVAGVAALVMSANPSLIGHPAEVETILKDTAVGLASTQNCGAFPGASIPNAVFGHGRVDALAAVTAAAPPLPDEAFADGFEDAATRAGD